MTAARACAGFALLLACGDDAGAPLVPGGTVIALSEGETRTIPLGGPATVGTITVIDDGSGVGFPRGSGADVLAKVVGGDLVIDASCSMVAGTSGSPVGFVVPLVPADGGSDVPLLVEIAPSGTGACEPTVSLCFGSGLGGDHPCGSNGSDGSAGFTVAMCGAADLVVGSKVDIDFIDGSSQPFEDRALPPQALALELDNPDSHDTLFPKYTTDAPIPITHDEQNETDTCFTIPNDGVIGRFAFDYVLARGMTSDAPVVAGGEDELRWNDIQGGPIEPYAIEPVSCSNTEVSCNLAPTGCLQSRGSGQAAVEVRLWATPAGSGAPYSLTLQASDSDSGAQLPLIGSAAVGLGSMSFVAGANIASTPLVVTVQLGAGERGMQLQLRGDGSGHYKDDYQLPILPCAP